jgi:catechol 2,3-dioxygenase-like lactoylglutathione lyase family enzyme
MTQHIAQIALLVPDYDAAIEFYCSVLGFTLIEDSAHSDTKRWVVVKPPGASEQAAALLLARAATSEQELASGTQAGGRVFLFLETDDFQRDYDRMVAAGVHFEEAPRHEAYGFVAVFQDPFGNRWDLIERR